MIVILGPDGVGKSTVAMHLAGPRALRLDTRRLQACVLDRVRTGRWEARLVRARELVLDEPVWLRNRPGVVEMLAELLAMREARGRKTMLCQSDRDGSIDVLIREMEAGSLVVLGLRFPKGKRGRLRFARRACDDKGVCRTAARGTDQLEPWRYDRVMRHLDRVQGSL